MEQNSGGRKGGIIVKTAQPGRGGLLGPGRKRAGLRPAKLDVASMSHRQRGAWAGGSGARATQLGSVSVQAGARTAQGGQSLSQRSGRLAGRGGRTGVHPAGRPVGSVGAGGFGDPHPENSPHSCSWAELLRGLTCSGTSSPGPDHQHPPLCPGMRGWASWWEGAAYRVSCSGSSGDWPPPSSSWARSCRSLSRRRRSRAASSSSSTLH